MLIIYLLTFARNKSVASEKSSLTPMPERSHCTAAARILSSVCCSLSFSLR